MIQAASPAQFCAPPAPFPPACTFVRDLPPGLVDASEIPQVRHEPRSSPACAQVRPISGAAIGFLRFRAEARAKSVRASNVGNSHSSAESPLKSLGREIDRPSVSILDRREFQCGWIVGAEASIATCCGAPVLTGKSWCPEHRARVFPKRGGR